MAENCRLSVIAFSGAFDRLHYALALSAAALAANRPATLFFTMAAVKGLLAPDSSGPGWRHLDPSADGVSPPDADAALKAKGIGGFEDLLAAHVALGGTTMVCEMGLRALGLELADLRPDIAYESGGLVTFLGRAKDAGTILFV